MKNASSNKDPYNSDTLNVVVSGFTYESIASAGSDPAAPMQPVQLKSGTDVEVSVETHNPLIPGELGWQPASGATVTPNVVEAFQNVLWQGQVLLPDDRQPGRCRLVVKEFETLFSDPTQPTDRSIFLVEMRAFPPTARSLVYAEMIIL